MKTDEASGTWVLRETSGGSPRYWNEASGPTALVEHAQHFATQDHALRAIPGTNIEWQAVLIEPGSGPKDSH